MKRKLFALLMMMFCFVSNVDAQKVSTLDPIGTPSAEDLMFFVDVSDTTLSATGTGKNINWDNMQGLITQTNNFEFVSVSSTTTLTANQFASVTTSGSDITVNLPATPTAGQRQGVSYIGQTFGDVVTIGRNGETINGMAADIKMFVADSTNGKFDTLEFVYDGNGWIITKDALTPLGLEADLSTAVFTSNTANTTTTGVPFDSITNQFGDMWDSSNYHVNILRSGWYHLNAVATNENVMTVDKLFAGNIRDTSTSTVVVPGDRISSQTLGASSKVYTSIISGTVWLDEGDEIELNVFIGEANIGLKATSGFQGIGTQMRIKELR